MENFFEILTNEDKSFEFPKYVYVLMPVGLMAIMAFASWLISALGYGGY